MQHRRCSAVGLSLFLFALGTVPGSGATDAPVASPPSLAGRFAQPPADARILKIIHGWPDAPGQQDALIGQLQTQGFGGVVCNVAFDGYLEDASKWDALQRAVTQARAQGMALWLYDERGYPSGNAGGLVLKDHPEWEALGWLVSERSGNGGEMDLALPPGKLVSVAAFPERAGQIDLAQRVNLAITVTPGGVSWQAPPGQWRVIAFTESRLYEGTHAELNLHAKLPYVNLLMPEPTARFLALTHERYAERLGADLGQHFVATFTDEPSLMSLFLRPMPYRVLPWAPDLPAEFRRRCGYALEPSVPALVADAGPAGRKVRHDYWKTIGALVSQNYFGQIQDWCRAHRVRSGGHLLAEEGLGAHVALYGDFFRCLRRLDAPGIDCLTSIPSEVPWYIARLAASAAELEGRSLVMCETSDHGQVYRPPGDARPKRTVTESEIRGTCNRLMVSGVNRITSYYSFDGLSPEALRRLNDWVGRCGTLLTGGHQVADVAVVYPVESLWTRFTPSRHWANEAAAAGQVEDVYRSALDSLFAARRDLTIIDSRTLAEATVSRGQLVSGPLRWRVVVLPGVDTLPERAWRTLAAFVRSGGVVIALGARPGNTDREFPAPWVAAWGQNLFGAGELPKVTRVGRQGGGVFLPAGSAPLLAAVLDGVLEREVQIEDTAAPLRVTHRRVEGHDLFFVINDSPQPWQGTVRLSGIGVGERWDPATGTMSPWSSGPEWVVALEPYGGAFFRFATAARALRRPLDLGLLPDLETRPLALGAPQVARGEFVRETLSADEAHSSAEQPAWSASARLTKGQVDTFLFVRFPVEMPLEVRGAEGLIVETWVPPDQRTPNHLLIILQEEGGGDFLARLPRSLAGPAADRCFLPFDRFQVAGWSQDGDGRLDLSRVREVRVGWGGYLGEEGEVVAFSVARPQLAALR